LEVTENQKRIVRARIKKYELHPELLIEEEKAIEMINSF